MNLASFGCWTLLLFIQILCHSNAGNFRNIFNTVGLLKSFISWIFLQALVAISICKDMIDQCCSYNINMVRNR